MTNMRNKENKIIEGRKNVGSDISDTGHRKGSKSGVSKLHRDSDSSGDTVQRSRLPRVQSSDGKRSPEELPERAKEMVGGDRLVGIERRIVTINAYRTLLKKKISLKGVPKEIENEILFDLRSWIESQVLTMIGGESRETFSQDEVQTLKALASQVKDKIGGARPSNPKQTTKTPSINPRSNARPLNEAIDTVQYNKEQMDILRRARELEEMERNGPTY